MGTQQASYHFHLFTLPSATPGWPTGSPPSVPFEGRLSLTSPYKSSHSQGVQAISFASFCIPNAHLSVLPTHDGNLATVVVPRMQQRNRQTQLTLPQSHHQDYSLPSPTKNFQKFSHLREAGQVSEVEVGLSTASLWDAKWPSGQRVSGMGVGKE